MAIGWYAGAALSAFVTYVNSNDLPNQFDRLAASGATGAATGFAMAATAVIFKLSPTASTFKKLATTSAIVIAGLAGHHYSKEAAFSYLKPKTVTAPADKPVSAAPV